MGRPIKEISDAIEKVSGRYKAVTRTISGVYSSEYKGSESEMLNNARQLTDEFAESEGRRPRILIAKILEKNEGSTQQWLKRS